MNAITNKQLRGLFTAIEINLLLWIVVCGNIWSSVSIGIEIKYFTAAGMIISAFLQHWAYYNLYKRVMAQEAK